MSDTSPDHWLLTLARDAGLAPPRQFTLPPATPIVDAWERVQSACGVKAGDLARLVATQLALSLADLSNPDPTAVKLLPERVATKHRVVPLRHDDRSFVAATPDPTDPQIEADIAFATGRAVELEVATPAAIAEMLAVVYGHTRAADIEVPEELSHAVEVVEEMGPEAVDAIDVEAAPVVRLSNIILRDAVRSRASDIHLEPGRGEGTVRFRVDGLLRPYMRMPMRAMNRVISRVKVIARLDIADRIRPQDGRARVVVEGRTVELRVSTVPTRESEKAVLRVLAQTGSQRVEEIQLQPEDVSLIQGLIRHRDGIVVMSGPTGSGKTTTLYAMVREIANGEVNVMTVEDPIEYEIPGVTQIQVEPRRNVTFASALRAVLRQDPDVVLIGEVRDPETAHVALQASMTGHLVLATLHTNDAASAVARLTDLGIDRPGIAATLRGVIAQRLVRRLCPDCAATVGDDLSAAEQELAHRFGVVPKRRPAGCPGCGETGYLGRLPITEVLVLGPELADHILRGASANQIEKLARASGMRTLREAALARVSLGETSLEEVDRVLGERAAEGTEAGHGAKAPSSVTGPPLRDRDAPAPGLGDASRGEISGRRVLVVDDDALHRRVARHALERAGFEVDEAATGAAGLEKASAGSYALVVTDLHMPGLGGREVVTCLRAMPSTAGAAIVVATGDEDAATESQLIDAGADDYIRKPLEAERFLTRVRAALRRADG